MGYKRAKKKYRLTFEDDDLAGFEVTMGSLSIKEFMEVSGAVSATDQLDAQNAILAKFATKIVHWNLEDDEGTPVPATLEGVQAQDMEFISQILAAWMEAMAGVDPTSRAAANGGGTFPEVSLPMERLSVSLPN